MLCYSGGIGELECWNIGEVELIGIFYISPK